MFRQPTTMSFIQLTIKPTNVSCSWVSGTMKHWILEIPINLSGRATQWSIYGEVARAPHCASIAPPPPARPGFPPPLAGLAVQLICIHNYGNRLGLEPVDLCSAVPFRSLAGPVRSMSVSFFCGLRDYFLCFVSRPQILQLYYHLPTYILEQKHFSFLTRQIVKTTSTADQ